MRCEQIQNISTWKSWLNYTCEMYQMYICIFYREKKSLNYQLFWYSSLNVYSVEEK